MTPHGWHVHLVHYLHKSGTDGSLSNHRPLTLIEVLRKVFTGIVVDRMRHDWSRLKVLDECNPGFQAGRTTANAILPVHAAAEYCVATKTEMAVLLDDLKRCCDTPANPVIELALMRLGVPAFYATVLNDIDMHSAKSTVTAAGLILDFANHLGCKGVHRQLHGTGQGTVEGALNWLPVADIAIAVARAVSTNPVTMPTGGGAPVEVPVAVYVDDSALAACPVWARVAPAELKTDWCRAQKLLGRSRDKTGSLMAGWIVVQQRPTNAITHQLAKWTQFSQLRVSDDDELKINPPTPCQ